CPTTVSRTAAATRPRDARPGRRARCPRARGYRWSRRRRCPACPASECIVSRDPMRRFDRSVLLTLLVALSPVAAGGATKAPAPKGAALSPKLDVASWELPNGLKVLFLPDHDAPIVTVQIFYHVGSKDEHVGIRGVAHMFEHLMFKGSQRVPPEEHARLLKEVGGQVNAFTTEDLTAYHDTVPPSYVGFALELEAARMRHL